MSDYDVIKQIEYKISRKLKEIPDSMGMTDRMLSTGYSLDENANVIGLYLSSIKTSLVEDIPKLKHIRSLGLFSTNWQDYSFISSLSKLLELSLLYNDVSDISFLSNLNDLKYLNASYTNIHNISFLNTLPALENLSLINVLKIKDFSILASLHHLKKLYIAGNNLSDVSFLASIPNLTSLDLSFNNITDVSFLQNMDRLEYVNLQANPNIITPPKEVLDQGIVAIRSYFKQKDKQGVDHLYEGKVLFVGEPDAGKTTLMRNLLNPKVGLNTNIDPRINESTLGIDVETWHFNSEVSENGTFKANLWDFGGQNIQYYIHQFFLTEDSVYVLLIDDRRELVNIDYWFQIITLLGKNSPVILVRNEKKIRSSTLFDQNEYLLRYGNDLNIEFKDVNLAINDGRLKIISDLIKKKLNNLAHVGNELPASWVKVVDKLRSLKDEETRYITTDEFSTICTDFEIVEKSDQEVLCKYLRALGKIVFFREDTGLSDTIFLDPNWITEAVYSILTDKVLENQSGEFSRKWIIDIWGKEYSSSEKDKFLLLMQKPEFDLCYRIDKNNQEYFLAPQLLQNVAPKEAIEWKREGSLTFRFLYKFMPKGIISRIIVRLNNIISKNSEGKPLAWRRGVILSQKSAVGLVKKDVTSENTKVIDISINGELNDVRRMLDIIHYAIESIHFQSFAYLKVLELYSCTCEQCKKSNDPTFFSNEVLLTALKKDFKDIQCYKSFELVDIRDIMAAVFDEEELMPTNRFSRFDDGKEVPRRYRRILQSILEGKYRINRENIIVHDGVHIYSEDTTVINEYINFKASDEAQPGKSPEPHKEQKRYWNVKIFLGIVTVIILLGNFYYFVLKDLLENKQDAPTEINQEEKQRPNQEEHDQNKKPIAEPDTKETVGSSANATNLEKEGEEVDNIQQN